MQQADDFLLECETLFALLSDADADRFDEPTQFKNWTINAVLQHLLFWNQMAALQIKDPQLLERQLQDVLQNTQGLRSFEDQRLGGLSGETLLATWYTQAKETAQLFAATDPAARLQWVGPGMSARSSITARLMETWAHGQEIFDHLGVVRQNKDRIRNIVILGVNTYSWTYKVRKMEPPGPMPFLRLTAPSGAIWEYGDGSGPDRIFGPAEDFCQVVTQTRNIQDTRLDVQGPIATDWMTKAQCFAGPPESPPAPKSRFTRTFV